MIRRLFLALVLLVTLVGSAAAVESANNTQLTTTSGTITDSGNNTWNLHSDPTNGLIVWENGAPPTPNGFSQFVTLLLYWNHQVYQENVANNFWFWQPGTGWVSQPDPRPPSAVNDLSLAGTQPPAGVPTNKLVYSVQEFPTNVLNRTPDSGTAWITLNNSAYGYLESTNVAPVWVSSLGASLDNTNGALADDQAFAGAIVAYLNGTAGSGAPTFGGGGHLQPMSSAWYFWGNQPTNPNGTLNADTTLKSGQQTQWFQLLFTPFGGGGTAHSPAWAILP